MNDEWKEIIAAEMEREADEIMAEVNSDPAMKDVQAPLELREEVYKKIQELEKQKIYSQLTEEDQELIRLGKHVKKQRKYGRYAWVAMAVIVFLTMGNVSTGAGKRISRVITKIFAGREQTVSNSGDTTPSQYNEEAETYEAIEKAYGFKPVQLMYLPQTAAFYEGLLGMDIQGASLIYEMSNGTSLIYVVKPNYREGSIGIDIEDIEIQKYHMNVNEVDIIVTEYVIEESGTQKWMAQFIYEDVLYLLRVADIDQKEMEKIVNNLHFFK